MHPNTYKRHDSGAPQNHTPLSATYPDARLRQAGNAAGGGSGRGSIVELVRSRVDTRSTCVPVLPAVARHMQRLLSHPQFSERQVVMLAGADPGLASKLLKAANAPFFKGLSAVSTVQDSFARLGTPQALDLVRQGISHDVFTPAAAELSRTMQTLWRHSFCCAVASRWLARRSGYFALTDEAFVGGLFHDIGKLFLLRVVEDLDHHDELHGIATQGLLTEVFETMHAEQGYRLLRDWSIPESLTEVARDHDSDSWSEANPLVAIVRLANLACRVCGVGPRCDPSLLLIATQEAHVLGVKEVLLAELEVVIEDAARSPMSAMP